MSATQAAASAAPPDRGDPIHSGTPGWTYDDWTGPFYPDAVRGAERLSFYADPPQELVK